ncbi:MAG: beta-ketoacyl synthase N-terminal-like domain-containing protein [Pirellulaceae bacterium]|nr:beta-ketoacyl synthase N-terminal-like domain-containing protein [Pirellulaceae bacterium]
MESAPATWEAAIVASATASASLAAIGPMRKQPPRFAGVDLPGHFLKHADEQTVIALEALRRAVEQAGLDPREQTDWAIVAAPRFIARVAGAHILTRYGDGGAPTVPPHALAQNSLHSVAGAASIALGLHGPNVGLGGGPGAISDGLTAALTLLDGAACPGLWLLFSQWEPEPIPDGQGRATNDPVCHAVALALRLGEKSSATLRLTTRLGLVPAEPIAEPRVSQLAACIERSASGCPAEWSLALDWGANIQLSLTPLAVERRLAA